MFRQQFGHDSPSRLTVYRIYQKFVDTGSVENNYRGNAGLPRSGRCELNIAMVQQALYQCPLKSTRQCNFETGIPQKTVWRILKQNLGMQPYHIHVA
ncbi:hypothetical protein ANN_27184 [Periplaneta americana]|uniref:DUF4817 domain-containing protein n=1 Tax=Periplaneta americana TaxID=6978 RepID=A0ABQ8RXF9_PERAM|nr:hypothetical protein ANN_27184 [Periplaneta americana]